MAAPGRFRELTHLFRECAAEGAAPPPIPWREFLRTHGIALVLAIFVAASGAFGTSRITAGVRYPVIMALAIFVVGIDLGIRALPEGWFRFKSQALLKAVRFLALLACTILVCWGVARLFEGAHGTPPVSRFVLPVVVFGAVAAALARMTTLRRTPTRVARRAWPAFVDRLPHPLQGAEIVAVEGEDHYVRVHTSLGRHLLHMRFGDALRELEGLPGRQTHRSWWVAKSAVSEVKRGNGRATLKLANGLEAPVSRRFARGLRDSGWY